MTQLYATYKKHTLNMIIQVGKKKTDGKDIPYEH